MIRRARRRVVDRAQATRYRAVARSLHASARDLAELGDDQYGNAVGILSVHAAIAWADALSIAWAGFKSTEGDHTRALEGLRDALGARVDEKALKDLLAIIQQKDTVSYQGVAFTLARARSMLGKLERFAAWAEETYEMRP